MTTKQYTIIPLTKGKVTIVDQDTADLWEGTKWYCTTKGYAATQIRKSDKKKATMLLHRVVANVHGLPGSIQPDHINGDPLDNRRENLRVCTSKQNSRSRKKHVDNTTGFKGVSRRYKKFTSKITVDSKQIHLGFFTTPEEAHAAYCEAAKKHFGEFARFN